MAVNAKNWQELKKPNALERKLGRRRPPHAPSFVAEPLERGFGMTLGNSLRRVLLSSLQGAAVTSIKIEGVLHEFSSLAGVREDVTDIVLNVKQIALKMEGEGPKRLQLSATGPGDVTAGMIADHRRHRGHQPRPRDLPPRRGRDAQHGADRRHREGLCPGRRQPPGRRADRPDPGRRAVLARSARSPTRSRTPASARSSTTTSSTLTIETDGTVTPEDALGYAARILQDQLQLFVHFDDSQVRAAAGR